MTTISRKYTGRLVAATTVEEWNDYYRRLDADADRGARAGGRRCPRHGQVISSSATGATWVCGECDHESGTGRR